MKGYSIKSYTLHPTALEALKRSEPWRCFLAAALAWVAIYLLAHTYLSFSRTNPVLAAALYVPVIFLIAGRAGVFLQLAHEAAHGLVGGKRLNQWFGNWMAAYPIGLDLKGYAEPHLRHHACANRACDPIGDREKYRVVTPGWELLGLLLKDACGWTAIRGRYLYDNAGANREEDQAEYEERGEEYIPYYIANKHARVQRDLGKLRHLAGIAAMQVLVLLVAFHGNPLHYVALWLIPLTTAHMVLMRIRGIGEHGLAHQLGFTMADFDAKNENGTYYTRSFGTPRRRYWLPLCWLERALIGSLNVYYHHEHHLAPKVPYYSLPRLHRLLAAHAHANNKHLFQPGYVACLFFRG